MADNKPVAPASKDAHAERKATAERAPAKMQHKQYRLKARFANTGKLFLVDEKTGERKLISFVCNTVHATDPKQIVFLDSCVENGQLEAVE